MLQLQPCCADLCHSPPAMVAEAFPAVLLPCLPGLGRKGQIAGSYWEAPRCY